MFFAGAFFALAFFGWGKLRLSKTLFAFLCALSLLGSLAFSQGLSPSAEETPAESAPAFSGNTPAESTLPIDIEPPAPASGQTGAAQGERRSAGTLWVFFRMVFALIAVAACVYFVMAFMRKKMSGGLEDDDTFLRRVAQVSVGAGKTVQIVTLLERAFLIGVTDNSIDLLGEITDKELVDAMNLNADRKQNATRARNFGEVLSLFLNPKSPNATEGERKASSSMQEFFKKQKEKFNDGK